MCTATEFGLATKIERGVAAITDEVSRGWRGLTRRLSGGHAALASRREEASVGGLSDVRVATAAIVLEMAEANHPGAADARRCAERTLRDEYGLSGRQAARLVRRADRARRVSPGIWTFTSVLVGSVSAAQRRSLTDLLERVDGSADAADWRRRYTAARIRWLLRVEGARV